MAVGLCRIGNPLARRSGLAADEQAAILAAHLPADPNTTTPSLRRLPLMPAETLEFLLLLSGWIVAFLLGRELQTGFRWWRLRTAEQRSRRTD
jgi:hypothetical protein